MKTMTLCAIAFALLLALVAFGVFDSSPAGAYILIFCAAGGWAVMMWLEPKDDETPAANPKGDGEV